MNKDKVKGKTNQILGETRERTGHAVGNEDMEAKGTTQVLKGKTQTAVGTIKDKAGDVKDKLKRVVKA